MKPCSIKTTYMFPMCSMSYVVHRGWHGFNGMINDQLRHVQR